MLVMPGWESAWMPGVTGSASRTSVAGEREHLPHLAVAAALEVRDEPGAEIEADLVAGLGIVHEVGLEAERRAAGLAELDVARAEPGILEQRRLARVDRRLPVRLEPAFEVAEPAIDRGPHPELVDPGRHAGRAAGVGRVEPHHAADREPPFHAELPGGLGRIVRLVHRREADAAAELGDARAGDVAEHEVAGRRGARVARVEPGAGQDAVGERGAARATDAARQIELAGLGEHDRRRERDPQVVVDADLDLRREQVAVAVELELAVPGQRRERIGRRVADLLAGDHDAVEVVLVGGLDVDLLADAGVGGGGDRSGRVRARDRAGAHDKPERNGGRPQHRAERYHG